MCGISGFISKSSSISGTDYYQAHSLMSHRGPDDEGFVNLTDGNPIFYSGKNSAEQIFPDIERQYKMDCVLGHSRLSILDLSTAGHQPMISDDGELVLVYNGELYNYKELRQELIQYGYQFRTQCDTEVVLAAYQKWKTECFNRFNGMWAMAIFHRKNRQLLLCRDRFGVKPLYYAQQGDTLIFASIISTIRKLLPNTTIHRESVENYLKWCWLCNGTDTFFNEIHEVPPAHYAIFSLRGMLSIHPYWDFIPTEQLFSKNRAQEQFKELFFDAVRLRMHSDVEVGSLLSGGLDSNLIVGVLGRNNLLSERYQTFSSVYDYEQYSEKRYIEQTQKKWNIKTNYVNISAKDVIQSLPQALQYSEMPLRAVPMVLQYKLYEFISKNSCVKVLLNGQGADELFGGYTDNYYTFFASLANQGKLITMSREIKKLKSVREIPTKTILYRTFGEMFRMWKRNEGFNDTTFSQIISTPLREYLMYDDRASMAFGLEARAPFLDYRLVEFAFTLAPTLKISRGVNKLLVRNCAKIGNLVAPEIVTRKDKMGFTSPQEIWQRSEWKPIFDQSFETINKQGLLWLDKKYLCEKYAKYISGISDDWSYIWRIFCLEQWVKYFV